MEINEVSAQLYYLELVTSKGKELLAAHIPYLSEARTMAKLFEERLVEEQDHFIISEVVTSRGNGGERKGSEKTVAEKIYKQDLEK